jgi:hypothetical protein
LIELPYFIDDTKFKVNIRLPYESFEKGHVAFGLGTKCK